VYCFGFLMTHRLPAQAGESAAYSARPVPAYRQAGLRLVIHSFVFRGAFSREVFLNTKTPNHVKRTKGFLFPSPLCYYRSIVLLVKQRKDWR